MNNLPVIVHDEKAKITGAVEYAILPIIAAKSLFVILLISIKGPINIRIDEKNEIINKAIEVVTSLVTEMEADSTGDPEGYEYGYIPYKDSGFITQGIVELSMID